MVGAAVIFDSCKLRANAKFSLRATNGTFDKDWARSALPMSPLGDLSAKGSGCFSCSAAVTSIDASG